MHNDLLQEYQGSILTAACAGILHAAQDVLINSARTAACRTDRGLLRCRIARILQGCNALY
jgi:hypothetical protein